MTAPNPIAGALTQPAHPQAQVLFFDPFRLDIADQSLWRGDEQLHLRRKPFDILCTLARNPRRLVTHEEIVAAVWGKVAMSESLLRTHVRELRRVLGDDRIETVAGRGYRLLGDVTSTAAPLPAVTELSGSSLDESDGDHLVGRAQPLTDLADSLARARTGRRQTVFIRGEAGVGKTTLLDAFLGGIAHAPSTWIARGASIDQYGSGEVYLPILDALGSLGRGRAGSEAMAGLAERAPSWVAQLPSQIAARGVGEKTERTVASAGPTSMLLELTEALEALAQSRTLVLVIEDLQWSDPSTVGLLSMLARRREPAHLLVIGTYRPADLAKSHAFAKASTDLAVHRFATTISVDALDEASLATYVAQRFPGHRFAPDFVHTIHGMTGGNPLFVVTLLDDLEGQHFIVHDPTGWRLTSTVADVAARRPDGIRRLIDIQIDRLGTLEQRILEAASVAGLTFTTGVVAHALDAPVDEVDAACEALASAHPLLQHLGVELWPDGTLQTRYGFSHALYQDAAFARVPSATVRHTHRRVAERLERGFAGDLDEVAGEVAVHYGDGLNVAKAAYFHALAGERAARRHGRHESLEHFEQARSLVTRTAPGVERDVLELRILTSLGKCLLETHGLDSQLLAPTFERARALATDLADADALARAHVGLQRIRLLEGDLREVAAHALEVAAVARRASDAGPAIEADVVAAYAALRRGRLAEAHDALLAVVDPKRGARSVAPEAEVEARALLALVMWLRGRPNDALSVAQEGVASAAVGADQFQLGVTLSAVGFIHALRGETAEANAYGERLLGLADNGRFAALECRALGLLSMVGSDRATSKTSDLDALTGHDLAGTGHVTRSVLTLARIHRHRLLGETERALEVVTEMLDYAALSDERVAEPELRRLRGELLMATSPDEAMSELTRAHDLACAMEAPAYELRCALSLHEHRRAMRTGDALPDLRAALSHMHGGFESDDVRRARQLLGAE